MDKNHIEGVAEQDKSTRNHTVLMTPANRRGSGSRPGHPTTVLASNAQTTRCEPAGQAVFPTPCATMPRMEKCFNTAGPNQPDIHYTLNPMQRVDWRELSGLVT